MGKLEMQKLPRKITGQGMTEYIIIVALIAIAAIAVYTIFGKTVRTQVGNMTKELAGDKGTDKVDSSAINSAVGSGKSGLKDFGGNAGGGN